MIRLYRRISRYSQQLLRTKNVTLDARRREALLDRTHNSREHGLQLCHNAAYRYRECNRDKAGDKCVFDGSARRSSLTKLLMKLDMTLSLGYF